jgi:hypothetical protein
MGFDTAGKTPVCDPEHDDFVTLLYLIVRA